MAELDSSRALLGAQGTAAAEAVAGRSGHGWEGENVKWHVGQPPPLFI